MFSEIKRKLWGEVGSPERIEKENSVMILKKIIH